MPLYDAVMTTPTTPDDPDRLTVDEAVALLRTHAYEITDEDSHDHGHGRTLIHCPPPCPACAGSGQRFFPVAYGPDDGDLEEMTCPTCHPWSYRFPGEIAVRQGIGRVWVTEPAEPNQPAVFHGYKSEVLAPARHHDRSLTD